MELFADKSLGMKVLLYVMSLVLVISSVSAEAREFNVYNVASTLPMGEPGEVKVQDYYVNMGSRHGLKKGDRLEALRRVPSYDMIDQEFSRDLLFPIAVLRILHIQSNAAICRLEKMLPARDRPTISPSSVMVGDYVRVLGSQEYPQLISSGDSSAQPSDASPTPLQPGMKVSLEVVEKPRENTPSRPTDIVLNEGAQPQNRPPLSLLDAQVQRREQASAPTASVSPQ